MSKKWLFLPNNKKVMLLHFNNDGVFDSKKPSRLYSTDTGCSLYSITQNQIVNPGTALQYTVPAKRMYGDASGYFDKFFWSSLSTTASRVLIPREDDMFEFGNEPFTIEFWIRQESSPYNAQDAVERTFIDCWNPVTKNGWKLNVPANYSPTLGTLPTLYKATFKLSDGSSYTHEWNFPSGDVKSSSTYDYSPNYVNDFRANNWRHYAITRDVNGVFRIFYHGTMLNQSTPSSAAVTSSYNPGGGANAYGYLRIGGSHKFYLDDFRITKGEALYTANYTPPTQELT